jgi:hypothetical protein
LASPTRDNLSLERIESGHLAGDLLDEGRRLVGAESPGSKVVEDLSVGVNIGGLLQIETAGAVLNVHDLWIDPHDRR